MELLSFSMNAEIALDVTLTCVSFPSKSNIRYFFATTSCMSIRAFFRRILSTHMSDCTRELDLIVPVDLDTPVVPLDTRPELIVLQALPTTFTVLLWGSLECLRRRRGVTSRIKSFVRILCAIAIVASSLLSWRVVELLQCDGYTKGIVWKILAAAAPLVLGFVLVVPLVSRSPRVAILLSLIVSSGIVVSDVGVRGWWTTSHAAIPLVSAQQLWNIVTVLLFLFLPSRVSTTILPTKNRTSRLPTTRRFDNVVTADALERRAVKACEVQQPRTSWFW